jgi:hypothetical protein
MDDIHATVQRLRMVRQARSRFLSLWAMECVRRRSQGLEHLAADLSRARSERAAADPYNRDWSLLYRGSVLDD